MQRRRDDRVLLVGDRRRRGLAHMIVGGQIWTNRDIVPGHKPKTRNVDLHVVVPQPTFVPGWVIGRAFDHRSTRRDGHVISKDPVWATSSFHNVFHRKRAESFGRIAVWRM